MTGRGKRRRKRRRYHFRRRLRERYGIGVSLRGLDAMRRQIRNGQAVYVRGADRGAVYDVRLSGRAVRVVYDAYRDELVTALPR